MLALLLPDGLPVTLVSLAAISAATAAVVGRRSLAGVEIEIRTVDGDPLPAGTLGEITVRGRTVFTGYLDDPETTAAAFLPGGWYRTADLSYLDAEGYLFVTGRVRETINRGGEKVAPAEIDAVLRAHPAIVDAGAFAIPDARLGEEVAAVVLRAQGTLSERALRRWVAGRLSAHKIPRRVWIVDEIPRTGSGKVQRGELSQAFRATRSEWLERPVSSA